MVQLTHLRRWDIMTCAHLDVNESGIRDTSGLNVVKGYALWCHYQPQDDERIVAYVEQWGFPVLALSERAGVWREGNRLVAAGFEPVWRFRPGTKEMIEVGEPIQ